MRVTDLDELLNRVARHEAERTARELQRVDIDADRLEDILEVPLACNTSL